MNPDLVRARNAAEEAAAAAENVINRFVQDGDWKVSLKQDDSPVTEVDVAAEHSIKTVLLRALPDAAFYGEETGSVAGASAQYRWLVDPIDGTKSFIRGMPFYSTQIALEIDNVLSVGVSNAPAYGERLVAVSEQGVWLNGIAVRCSEVTRIEDAFLSSGNLGTLARHSADWLRYAKLVARARRVRGYGDFCHYHQLCCGQTDLVVESDVNILDIAALCVAVRAAGGVITDLSGRSVSETTTSVLAASTQQLHDEALALLSGDAVAESGIT